MNNVDNPQTCDGLHRLSEDEIKTAALLAWEGYLTSVKCLRIENISIRDVPLEQMKKLLSIVTGRVNIFNMTHTDKMGSIPAGIM